MNWLAEFEDIRLVREHTQQEQRLLYRDAVIGVGVERNTRMQEFKNFGESFKSPPVSVAFRDEMWQKNVREKARKNKVKVRAQWKDFWESTASARNSGVESEMERLRERVLNLERFLEGKRISPNKCKDTTHPPVAKPRVWYELLEGVVVGSRSGSVCH